MKHFKSDARLARSVRLAHCISCGRIRKHATIAEGIEYGNCMKCRKKGRYGGFHCRFCGVYRCEQHNDECKTIYLKCEQSAYQHLVVVPGREECPEESGGVPLGNDFDEEDYDEEDYDESTEQREDYDEESPPYKEEDSCAGGSHASSRYTRHQCDTCKTKFDDLEQHRIDDNNDMGCKTCQEWFPDTDIWEHARRNRHDSCFVQGCEDIHARLRGWSNREVQQHVYQSHHVGNRPSSPPRRARFEDSTPTMANPIQNRMPYERTRRAGSSR